MKNRKADKPRQIRLEIIVAVIGVLGTIVAALISAWSNLAEKKMLIDATRTAETTPPPILSIPTETSTLQTDTTEAWKELFNVEVSQDLCRFTSEIAPEWFIPLLGTSEAIQKWRSEGTESWSLGPGTSNPVTYSIDLGNISNNKLWSKISNSFRFTVSRIEDAPNHASVLLSGGGCGGGSFHSSNTSIALSSDYITTEQKVVFDDFDYYTLQPGESEFFLFDVQCKSTGVYLLDIDISYTFDNGWNEINWKSPKYIVCPETFSSWAINPNGKDIVFYKNFSWDKDNKIYVESP